MKSGHVHLSHDRQNAACGAWTESADELTTDTTEVTCRDCCDVGGDMDVDVEADEDEDLERGTGQHGHGAL